LGNNANGKYQQKTIFCIEAEGISVAESRENDSGMSSISRSKNAQGSKAHKS